MAKLRNEADYILETRQTGSLHSPGKQLRKRRAAALKVLQRGVQELGFSVPIVIDETGEIIDGNARWEIAKRLGMQTVPVVVTPPGMSAAQKQALRVSLNKVSELAVWDEEVLKSALEEILSSDVSVDILGFEAAAIERLLTPVPIELGVDPDEIVDKPSDSPPTSQIYDAWRIGDHMVYHGDATDPELYAHAFAAEKPALVFADPPYNLSIKSGITARGSNKHADFVQGSGELSTDEFRAFLGKSMTMCSQHAKNGALHYWCMDWRHALDLQIAAGGVYSQHLQTCIWGKTNWGVGDFYRGQYEMVFVYKSGEAPHINNIVRGKHGRSRSNLWSYAGATSFSKTRKQDLADHPTVKPLTLVADLIRDASNPDDVILDPFGGSGTTLIAAHQTKRKAVLIELDGAYVDVILKRAQRLLKIEPIHVRSGKTFIELASERRSQAA